MKPIAKINFSVDGVFYNKGDLVEVKDMKQIVKLNEKGFVEPLSIKDLTLIEKELKSPKKPKTKEEE